jgi:hypothetical protein
MYLSAGCFMMFWEEPDPTTLRLPKAKKPKPEAIEYEELVGAGNIPPNFQSPNFKEAWEKWLEFRKSIGNSVKATSARLQIRDLVKMGKALAIESIEQSIKNGWHGLFDVKNKQVLQQNTDYSKRDEMDRRNREEALKL